MVRRVEKIFWREVKARGFSSQTQKIRKTTVWFLFIPIYSNEEILISKS